MPCHGYEGVMSVLCTPLQVKCYQPIKKVGVYVEVSEQTKILNPGKKWPFISNVKIILTS